MKKMSLKAIDTAILAIARNTEAVNEEIQTVALAIIAHAQEHGDCTRALRLVQALPKSFRRNLLVEYFATYSPIGMNVGTGKVGLHKQGSKLYRPFDLKTASVVKWYNQPQAAAEDIPDTTLVDAKEMASRLAKRLQKKIDEASVANDDVAGVTALIATLNAAAA